MNRRRLVALALTVGVALAGAHAVGAAATDDGTHVVHDGEQLALEAGPGQVVAGTSDLPPGTTLRVRVRSFGGENPFLLSVPATVGQDGRFRAAFDLSGVAAGTDLRVAVHHDGEELATTDGQVLECTDACGDPPADRDGTSVVHDGAELELASAPGQVVAGTSDRPPGTELVVRIRSSDGDQPFMKSSPVVVAGDGTFRAVFDFAGVSPGATFEATVRGPDGAALASVDGSVGACTGDCRPGQSSPSGASVALGTSASDGVDLGETAPLLVGVGENGVATVAVRGDDGGYALVATVRDADGDGEVRLAFDTGAASGDEGRPLRASDDDVTVVSETGTATATDYTVEVYDGTDASGSPADVAILAVTGAATATPPTTPPGSLTPGVGTRGRSPLGVGALGVGGVLGIVGITILLRAVEP